MRLRTIPLLSLLFLASCTVTAPDYEMLEAQADPAPSPDAIVGMWNYNHPGGGGWDKFSLSELFRSDGTGVSNAIYITPGAAEHTVNSRWTYLGGGVWRVTYETSTSVEIRISEGKLLMKLGLKYLVLKKVTS